MSGPRWLDEGEERVWRAFVDLDRDLLGALERRLVRDSGLSAAEFRLLVPLSEAPDGLLRARELGLKVGWDRSRLSHQVRRMENRGLLSRENCDEDARGSMVRLTPCGRAAIERAAPDHVEAVRTYFFDALTDEDLEHLKDIFERLLGRLPQCTE